MTSITQQIPNYVGGISQQPDELKVPGQVRAAKNVLPDVTHGLLKRPGGRLIGNALSAYTTSSKWFHYYRDENEQYIGQIQLSSGEIKMWKCDTGVACTVNYESSQATALKNYLKTVPTDGTSIKDSHIQTLTLNDYTYLTNRNKPVAMLDNAATVNPVRTPEAYIELKKVAYASQYSVNLFGSTALDTVTTATRIKVELEKSSNNYCNNSTANDGNGNPLNGTMGSYAERITNTFTTRCSSNAGDNRDAYAPNVGTRIFSIDDGELVEDRGPWNPTTDHGYNIDVKDSGGNSVNRGKNLYFRIATTGQSVAFTSGSDTTYQARYTTTHDLLYGGEGWLKGDYFYVWMKNAYYRVTIEEISTSKVQADLGLIRPEPTSFDTKTTVTAESIIGAIRTDIVATGNFTDANVQQIGNGIYITRPSGAFNISTPVGDLLNVFTNSVKDVADLPSQCKHGYVVKVSNSEAEEDDYYVKFIGKQKADGTYLDGDGVWEECPEPGVKTQLDPGTMPVQLVREADGTFTLSQVDWEKRLVGDTTTVPEPSFIGKTINKMLFFRNRLVLLSDENVIMSRPGDFYNFWPKSAITYTASDNIDISCSSEYPAIVYDGLQVNSGLVLFTKNQQFMLTTDSDVLSPLTAKINALSTYNFNFESNPISLGTTIAFLDNAGKYTRFFEMQAVLREGEPNVLEQSKNISKLFPKNIDLVANSRENGTIFFGVKGTNKLYGFRYYQTGERRVQQAWFEWELSGTIEHIAMLDDALYAVVKNTGYTMQKFSLKLDDNSHTIVSDDTYRVHLDNSKSFAYTNLAYVADGDYTKLDHTAADFSGSGQLYAVAVSTSTDKEFNGLVSKVTTFEDASDGDKVKVKIPSNWTTSTAAKAFNVVIGYAFDMEVEFPNFYVTQQEGERFTSDVQSSLVLHRIKLSLGPTGVYNTNLKRLGKPDYPEIFESVKADAYSANAVGIDNIQVITLPVYEKNTNLTLTLKSTHPTPATLYSLNWEGDYSNRYYKRV
jgi:uncharacterized protein YaiE (UPF0345 family)